MHLTIFQRLKRFQAMFLGKKERIGTGPIANSTPARVGTHSSVGINGLGKNEPKPTKAMVLKYIALFCEKRTKAIYLLIFVRLTTIYGLFLGRNKEC